MRLMIWKVRPSNLTCRKPASLKRLSQVSSALGTKAIRAEALQECRAQGRRTSSATSSGIQSLSWLETVPKHPQTVEDSTSMPRQGIPALRLFVLR